MTNAERKLRVNQQIRAREVRLIDENGQQLGVFPLSQALAMARTRNLDLVEVAPQTVPPVCRILDYGKFLYERRKKEREARKAQKAIEVKEIRLRPKTGNFHRQLKVKRIREFLADGAKVKVRILFRGREITHPEVGRGILQELTKSLEDVAAVEMAPQMEGRSLFLLLAPARKKSAGSSKDAQDKNP